MANINYSDIFPVSTSGSSTIAGMTFAGIKSADFTAVANSIYEITASCKMTLPSSPSTNDRVAFFLTSTADFDITSTDKINGSYLATDYVKRVTQLFTIIVLTYSGSTNGWTWASRDNNYFTNRYLGIGILVPYTNPTTFNGVFYNIGTKGGSQSWVNPYTANYILATASIPNIRGTGYTGLFDGVINIENDGSQNSVGTGTDSINGQYWQFDLKNNRCTPSNVLVYLWNSSAGQNNSLNVLGSTDGSTWDTMSSPQSTQLSPNGYRGFYLLFSVNTTMQYRYIRLLNIGAKDFPTFLFEIELFGTLILE